MSILDRFKQSVLRPFRQSLLSASSAVHGAWCLRRGTRGWAPLEVGLGNIGFGGVGFDAGIIREENRQSLQDVEKVIFSAQSGKNPLLLL